MRAKTQIKATQRGIHTRMFRDRNGFTLRHSSAEAIGNALNTEYGESDNRPIDRPEANFSFP